MSAPDFHAILIRYRDLLGAHEQQLNRLNVFPVADGDTGTNMLVTVERALAGLEGDGSMRELCTGLAEEMLKAGRGNSGVILSQMVRGLTEVFAETEHAGMSELVAALRRASEAAYAAVRDPVEGTMLTVAREAAAAAEAAGASGDDLAGVLDAAAGEAVRAVARTPQQLSALGKAGVVDAGGKGLALLFDAFQEVLHGAPGPRPRSEQRTSPAVVADIPSPRFEVVFMLEAADEAIVALQDAFGELGESIVVVGGSGLWRCHVHTDEPDAVVAVGRSAGRVTDVEVDDLFAAAGHETAPDQRSPRPPANEAEPPTTAVVAVAEGQGLAELLERLGAYAVVDPGRAGDDELRDVAASCPSSGVLVLTRERWSGSGLSGSSPDERFRALHIESWVQALAAMVAYDPGVDLETNLELMGETASWMRWGEVVLAGAEGAEGGEPAWIARSRDGVEAVRASAVDAATALLESLRVEEAEVVTVLVGADAAEAERLTTQLTGSSPHFAVEIHDGGQPGVAYVLGAE